VSTVVHDDHSHPAPLEIPPLDPAPVRRAALISLVVGWVAFAVLGGIQASMSHATAIRDFFLTYLVGYVFWFSLPFGAMALMMIGYLTTASWGVIFRRTWQAATRSMWLLAVLLIPIIVSLFIMDGKVSPFWWSDVSWRSTPEAAKQSAEYQELHARYTELGWKGSVADVAAAKHLPPLAVEEAQEKIHDYLIPWFFTVRAIAYFIILGGIIIVLNRWGQRAETTDDARTENNLIGFSGPFTIVWGLVGTLAVTDWIMSVEPAWASSMFPVVFGMNAFMISFCIGILVVYTLGGNQPGVMAIIKDKFRIDIGSLLLAFTMVWAYATFCQYMLIYAGNLPEEILYFRKRGDHGWQYMAYFLMLFHWLVPFVVLLFREVKTVPSRIKTMAVLLLIIGATDMIWWIVPAIPHPEGWLQVPMAFAAVLGVGGIWGLEFARQLGKRPILPANNETRFLAAWGHGH
jgi:hypothetical protein